MTPGRWLSRLRYSLSARLMVLFLLTGAVIAALLGNTINAVLGRYFERVVRPHLILYLDYVRQDLGDPPSIARARALTARVPIDIYITGPDINWASTSIPLQPDQLRFHRHAGPGRAGERVVVADERDRFVLKTQTGNHTVYLVAEGRERSARRLFAGLLALAAMLLTLYLCYRAIRWLFQPLQTLTDGVRRIGAGELQHRIVNKRRDELATLSASINAMADDIEKMLDAKRQLLLALSHELRSPLTRARIHVELLEPGASQQALQADLREMETLIGELLETERLHQRHRALNLVPCSINALLQETLSDHFPDQPLELNLDPSDAQLPLDSARSKLLLKNLLDNALRYNRPEHGPVALTVTSTAYELRIAISDQGPGIAPQHLPHLSEPFYRVDLSRQRKTGGYGLGLYLCRMIVEAHGGRLELTSRLGCGTTVTIILPRQTT